MQTKMMTMVMTSKEFVEIFGKPFASTFIPPVDVPTPPLWVKRMNDGLDIRCIQAEFSGGTLLARVWSIKPDPTNKELLDSLLTGDETFRAFELDSRGWEDSSKMVCTNLTKIWDSRISFMEKATKVEVQPSLYEPNMFTVKVQ